MANLIDTDAKIINARIEGYGHPSVIRTSGGRIYVGHVIAVSGDLEIHYSDNNGSSWTLNKTYDSGSGNGDIDMFSFAVSDQDDVFITYSYTTAPDVYTLKVQKRDYSLETWSEVLEVTNISHTTYKLAPKITWNRYESNRLHIFWRDVNTVKNKYSDNYGSSWIDGTNWALAATTEPLYNIDSDPTNGEIYQWHKRTSNSGYIKFSSVGVKNGLNDISVRFTHALSGLIDSNGDRWFASYRVDGATKRVDIYKNTVYTQNLYTGECKLGMVSIGRDGSDNIYVFYTKIDEKTYYRKYDKETSTWESEITLTSGDGLRIGCEQHTLIDSNELHLSYYID